LKIVVLFRLKKHKSIKWQDLFELTIGLLGQFGFFLDKMS